MVKVCRATSGYRRRPNCRALRLVSVALIISWTGRYAYTRKRRPPAATSRSFCLPASVTAATSGSEGAVSEVALAAGASCVDSGATTGSLVGLGFEVGGGGAVDGGGAAASVLRCVRVSAVVGTGSRFPTRSTPTV